MSNMPSTVKSSVDNIVADIVASELSGKKFWFSRTFWANITAAVCLGLQMRYGFIIGAEYQALALTVINLLLRKITKEPVVW